MIIHELRTIQDQFGYLPREELKRLSQKINVPLYELHGVASFFPHFRLVRPPAVDIGVCMDMPCHLHGCAGLKKQIDQAAQESKLDVEVRPVSCLGQCDRAPAVAVNDHIFGHQSPRETLAVVTAALKGAKLEHQSFGGGARRHAADPYDGEGAYGVVKDLLQSQDFEGVLEKLKSANLRGMGGAGFPTGVKWELVRKAEGDEKYVVCNADESEVGTIKDREIMKDLPHLLVEGMIIAGLVTGARKGIIYIRHEYHEQEEVLREEIIRARHARLVGDGLLGSNHTFHLEIFVSPGGYICGEESALLEALEGKRAQPRNKPPFPVTQGLWNKPTVINNVETFIYVPLILKRGPEWFQSRGRNGIPGLKFVGVSGHVNNPGVFEVAMGTPISEVIYDHAGGISQGRRMKAFAPSGASSGFLPASMADVPMDFQSLAKAGSMMGSGAIVVAAEGTCLLDLALNAVRFFRNESCGKCVPCRVGSQKLVDILFRISQEGGTREDLEVIERMADTLMMTSICGLGQVVPKPITSVIQHFPGEIEDHIVNQTCPSGVCFSERKTG